MRSDELVVEKRKIEVEFVRRDDLANHLPYRLLIGSLVHSTGGPSSNRAPDNPSVRDPNLIGSCTVHQRLGQRRRRALDRRILRAGRIWPCT